jgi:hypothetical protein
MCEVGPGTMVKLAVLVIDADDEPVYRVGREMWRLASKLFGVPVFFLRADKRVVDDGVYIDDDTILASTIVARMSSLIICCGQICHLFLELICC